MRGARTPVVSHSAFRAMRQVLTTHAQGNIRKAVRPLTGGIIYNYYNDCVRRATRRPETSNIREHCIHYQVRRHTPRQYDGGAYASLGTLRGAIQRHVQRCTRICISPRGIRLPQRSSPIQRQTRTGHDRLGQLRYRTSQQHETLRRLCLSGMSKLVSTTRFSRVGQTFKRRVGDTRDHVHNLRTRLRRRPRRASTTPTRERHIQRLTRISRLAQRLTILLIQQIVINAGSPLAKRRRVAVR